MLMFQLIWSSLLGVETVGLALNLANALLELSNEPWVEFYHFSLSPLRLIALPKEDKALRPTFVRSNHDFGLVVR